LCVLSAALFVPVAPAAEPTPKPVPAVEVLPLPNHEASFQQRGIELTRYRFAPSQERPFCYPMLGPAGRSLTRMGHPRDPFSHSHHNSVWISHENVGGINFWGDRGKDVGRIVHQRIEQLEDGDCSAWILSTNAWQDQAGKTLLLERRRIEVQPLEADQWLMLIDLQLEAPAAAPVTLGQTPFGLIGVRMAKTIGVADGGGRILNSAGQLNEKEMFRKPARWVDYSGPVTNEATGGITLMDHPKNPGHPALFHVRNDGWMGACLTLDLAITIESGKPLRLRYGLWMHAGVPKAEEIEKQWQPFSRSELPPMAKQPPAPRPARPSGPP
jgi:hypothetical protein